MRVFVFFALLAATFPSFSGDYSDAVRKQSKCESAGTLSSNYFAMPKDQFKAAFIESGDMAKEKNMSKKTIGDIQFLMILGNMAKSKKDAYMEGWSWCMDQK